MSAKHRLLVGPAKGPVDLKNIGDIFHRLPDLAFKKIRQDIPDIVKSLNYRTVSE